MLAEKLSENRAGVSAEFAVLLPIVVLVLGLIIGSVMLAGVKIALTSAAFEIARLEARGDSEQAQSIINQLPVGVQISRAFDESHGYGILCVTLSTSSNMPLLKALKVSTNGCAAQIN